MESKQVGAHPSGVSNNPLIGRGSRVCEKSHERERGTVIMLGTEGLGRAGSAWVKFDRRPGTWVGLTQLEALGMPAANEQPVAEEAAHPEEHKT